jgi:hypothetical protein
MATETDRIRREIAATRAEAARDVERLARRTNAGRVGSFLRKVKDRTMGSSKRVTSTVADAASEVTDRLSDAAGGVSERLHRAGESAGETLHEVGDSVRQAAHKATHPEQGSPIGVGLIAFGGGLLAAALIPETEAERRAVHHLSERAGPILEPLREAGRSVAGDLRETVGATGEHVQAAAVEAVGHVRSAAADGAAKVGAAASEGVADVRTAVQTGVDDVRTAAGDTSAAWGRPATEVTRDADRG